ncbi:hypothetical protein IEU95_07415 [Hoyosella rhizosphaerae]|uniref:Uncharacterized protein n=1 Tax=Hoyosella rhizosphaerae TaxID=1755582 RepID=A0A916U336_9ACTN|nr:hypothetical protein [Hoyosella rhizosphaerae]MBN4926652.1 hypothetical protein [Hoyosella rhizosphaerae]GGC57549.1 hypothetical protein GCM10011410_07560 [Hoyosella rhizosphaerae]
MATESPHWVPATTPPGLWHYPEVIADALPAVLGLSLDQIWADLTQDRGKHSAQAQDASALTAG